MARAQSAAASSSTTRKRKSTGGIEDEKSKAVKKPRNTLHAFFTPQVAISTKSEKKEEAVVVEHVPLNEEQVRVLRMVVEDEQSVFFTGAAGTGKSLLLRAIISALRHKYAKKPAAVAITASTGMAASNVGGTTIHAWGAITPGLHDIDKLISYIKTCKPAHQRWKSTKVLIIDEVSMVDGQLFDTMAKLADYLRKKTDAGKPFGGIQLIVTGDFFQLPPVTKGKTEPFFAFQSEAWKTCIKNVVTLKQVFRQKDDHFVSLLNELRKGAISSDAHRTFISLSRPLAFPDGILPTELFPLRTQVESANVVRLNALKTPLFTFEAHDTGNAAPERREKLLETLVVPRKVELKLDAQVMLVKNVDESAGLVNGAVGRIVGFFPVGVCVASTGKEVDLSAMKTADAKGKAKEEKLLSVSLSSKPSSDVKPLSSSQGGGHTAVAKLGGFIRHVRVGADGRTPLGYVLPQPEEKENSTSPLKELSTPTSPSRPKPLPLPTSPSKSKKPRSSASPTKAPASASKPRASPDELFPLVHFLPAHISPSTASPTDPSDPSKDGDTVPTQPPGEFVLIVRDEFRLEDSDGKLLARRVQLPLVLAWAMSIHKAQGQTIQRVKVDLRRVFERGQCYVALSRASCVEGLQVVGFESKKVMAHPKVIEWSKSIEAGDEPEAAPKADTVKAEDDTPCVSATPRAPASAAPQ